MPHKYEYAMYRGDRFIGIGTREELCKLKGININTFSFFQSPAYRSRIQNYNNTIYIVKLGRIDMKMTYSDLKEMIIKQWKEHKDFIDDFSKHTENYWLDEYYQQEEIKERTLRWLLDDIEEMEIGLGHE